MGLFDSLFGKRKSNRATQISTSDQRQNTQNKNIRTQIAHSSESASLAPFSKLEFQHAIQTIAKMSYLFRDSIILKSTNGNKNQIMMQRLHSYAGMLGYIYEFTYNMGSYPELVDSQMKTHYALVVLSMDDTNHRKKSINQLADNWSDVLQTIHYMQMDGTNEGNKLVQLQPEIDFVTKVFETISGSKCHQPKSKIGTTLKNDQASQKDRFSKMIELASFNPFKITTIPSLQNNPPLPEGLIDVFKTELIQTFSHPTIRQSMDEMQIFSSYVFNMVESYFNNAGYVPISTVDAIIEQCYTAIKQTQYGSSISSLDDVKFYIYSNLTNQ